MLPRCTLGFSMAATSSTVLLSPGSAHWKEEGSRYLEINRDNRGSEEGVHRNVKINKMIKEIIEILEISLIEIIN